MTKILHIICADRRKTEWMQAGGVFESFKVLLAGSPASLEIEFSEPIDLTNLINKYKQSVEREYRVVAIFFDGDSTGAFVDETVMVVSNGKSWVLLKDMLKGLNYRGAESKENLLPIS